MDKDFGLWFLEHSEFTIYAEERSNRVYQIKSNNLSNVEIQAYPSKQVVGKLQHHENGKVIELTVEVLNNQSRRWQKGKMTYTSVGWADNKIDIVWNGRLLKYVHGYYGVPGAFFIPPDTVLAECQHQTNNNKRRADFEIEIYSNEIPDPAYLLFIAALAEIKTPSTKGK